MFVVKIGTSTIETFGGYITGIATTTTVPLDFAYAYDGPTPTTEIFDDRHNPKAWAEWFREFLEELLGAGLAVIKEARQRHPLLQRIERNCRSAPLMRREWVLKLWKQAH